MVTVSVDGSVLDRIAKIMSYLRLGSSGKVLKKKKKEKDAKGIRSMLYLVFLVLFSFFKLPEDRCFCIDGICFLFCFLIMNNSFGFHPFLITGRISAPSNGYDEEGKISKPDGGFFKNRTSRNDALPPPPPPPPPPRTNHVDSKEKQGPAVSRTDDDDIFVGDGVEYAIPGKDVNQSPLSEDMEESPRNKEKISYFAEPAYGPVQPSGLPQEWQETVC